MEQPEAETAAIGPAQWYVKLCQQPGFQPDPWQQTAIERLQRLYDELVEFKQYRRNPITRTFGRRRPPRGLYLWGGVGRGKSLLMDALYTQVPLKRKRRVHFHAFMRDVHDRMRALTGEADPLVTIADDLAKRTRLLCFDEFHVSDIADAMILGHLLEETIERGVVYVMTSNYVPDELYPNGLQRARFLPAIELIKRELDVLELNGGVDHRQRVLEMLEIYHYPLDPAADQVLARDFDALSRASWTEKGAITIGERPLKYRRRTKGVIWFDFAELCGTPRSQIDYLEIASHYHTVLLSNVPAMGADQASEARRFTWLVDVFYDQRVKLIISAAAAPEQLYRAGPQAQEFERTASRLREMQSREYFARAHASAKDPHLLEE